MTMIQDFPEGSANLLFGIIFAENCMKMKKTCCWGHLDPPLHCPVLLPFYEKNYFKNATHDCLAEVCMQWRFRFG